MNIALLELLSFFIFGDTALNTAAADLIYLKKSAVKFRGLKMSGMQPIWRFTIM